MLGKLFWIEVDRSALLHNLRLIKSIIGTTVMPIIKGNAYGHGLVEVARTLNGEADIFGVVSFAEALALHEAGVKTEIVILGKQTPSEMKRSVELGFSFGVFDFEDLENIEQAQNQSKHGSGLTKVHIKIETGINRLGFQLEELSKVIEVLKEKGEIRVEGVFSHLASVEELNQSYTEKQIEKFEEGLKIFASANIKPKYRHIAASAAAVMYPETRYDLTRLGIMLYGLPPSAGFRLWAESKNIFDHERKILPILSYRARIVHLKDVRKGGYIGYGCSFQAPRDLRLAVLSVGYAEGLPRAVSGRGEVLIAGQRAKIIGRVCMNMTMVDVTDIDNVKVGEIATLIGRDGEAEITADELAKWADTINYEITTHLPSSLPRFYNE